MNILILSDNFPPERNAAAARIFERACYWVRWGHEVTVVTSAPNFPDGELFEGYQNRWHQTEDMSGIRVVRVKTFIAPNRGTVIRVVDFLSYLLTGTVAGVLESRPDVVLATTPQFFAGIAGAVVARGQRCPFVLEVSDLWPAGITAVGAMKPGLAISAVEQMELALYRASARIILLTQAFQDDFARRGVRVDNTHVILNGVDMDRYSARPKDHALLAELGLEGKLVAGYLGTLGMPQGLENVVAAADLLRARDDLRILLVGPGSAREDLMKEATRRELSNVVFVPPVPKEQIARYWSLCDIALVHLRDRPMLAQVIPSKIFEAMGMGVPVLLVAPSGDATRLVEEERVGRAVAPERPEALAEAIVAMGADRAALAELAANSAAAASRHTRETQARRVLEVLHTAARLRRAAA